MVSWCGVCLRRNVAHDERVPRELMIVPGQSVEANRSAGIDPGAAGSNDHRLARLDDDHNRSRHFVRRGRNREAEAKGAVAAASAAASVGASVSGVGV